MNPITWDWDYLIHRHLAGGLTLQQRNVLNDRLRIDDRLRRRLAELAFEEVVVRECARAIQEGSAVESGAAAAAPLLKPAASNPQGKKARKRNGSRRGKNGGGRRMK